MTQAEIQALIDAVCGINVQSYSTFQEAIDACPNGGGLVVPPGIYDENSAAAAITQPLSLEGKRIRIRGVGTLRDEVADGGAILQFNDPDEDAFVIDGAGQVADGTIMDDIYFQGANTAGSGRGLVIKAVHHLTLNRCRFGRFPTWAVSQAVSTAVDDAAVSNVFNGCFFGRNVADGLVSLGSGDAGTYSTNQIFRDCHFIANTGVSLFLNNCTGTRVLSSVFENDLETVTAGEGKEGSFILWQGGNSLTVRDSWFERVSAGFSVADTPDNWMIYMDGARGQATIDANVFIRTNAVVKKLRAIKLNGSVGPRIVRITGNIGALSNTTSGTDDIKLDDAADQWVHLENNLLTDTSLSIELPWRVSSADFGHVFRVNDSRRIRMQSSSTSTLAALTDADNGDMAFSSTDSVFQFRQGGALRRPISIVYTGGVDTPPSSGTWAVGDEAFNTSDNKKYVCTTAGVAGSGAAFKKSSAYS